jgi:LysM repeat protein
MSSPQRTAKRNAGRIDEGGPAPADKQSWNEVRTMPKHALKRPVRARMFSARRAVVVGTFAAVSCAVVTGTAHAAGTAPAASSATGATSPGTDHAAAKATAKAAAKATTATYTVKPGDTLYGIARSHKVPGGWRSIARINKISSPYIIHPGQVLKLPGKRHVAWHTSWHTGWHTAATTSSSTLTVVPAPAAKPAATTTTTTATTTQASTTAGTAQTYPDNLDGWINHSLAIMAQNGIPGSYDGIYRNVMRESSGNPSAINLWDSNAAAGHPSIGLLQVIQPTFDAYHVPGTSTDIYDPVANITAACNYAYHVYGSIDNVNGPY